MAKQDSPHCHAMIHPPAPVPTPVAHPALPLELKAPTIASVIIEGKEAATVGTMTDMCKLPSCVPNGPGIVSMGSSSVFHMGLPAARVNDMTAHAGCVAIIPSPVGKIMSPGATKTIIGG